MVKNRKGNQEVRTALKQIGSKERRTFYGTFIRYGIKNGYKGPLKTILLVDIKDENEKTIASHLWFNLTKGFKSLELAPGDLLTFKGRIKPYIKGYMGRRSNVFAPIEMDYHIQYPTHIQIVKKVCIDKGANIDARNSK